MLSRVFSNSVNLWRRWWTKASFTILDQIVFSAANLILNIFLARQLLPAKYGIFAIVFSIFLFLSCFHHVLILEPMSVVGIAYYRNRLNKYVGAAIWIHIGLTLVFSVATLLTAVIMFLAGSQFSESFFGLTLMMPLFLFFWLFRQICYLQMRPESALKGSLLYALILFLGLFISYRLQWLSSFNALIIMGAAGLLAASVFLPSLFSERVNIFEKQTSGIIKEVIGKNWHYGKWGVGSAFVHWFAFIVYLPMVGAFAGLSQAGAFRAMQNMVLPAQRIFAGLGLLLLPWLSRQRAMHGGDYLRRKVAKITAINFLITGVYVALLILFKEPISEFLYGKSYYIEFLWLVPYLGFAVIVEALSQGLSLGLKALERPDAIFWSKAFAAALTLTGGVYLVARLKLFGAALGTVLSVTVAIAALYFFMRGHFKPKKQI